MCRDCDEEKGGGGGGGAGGRQRPDAFFLFLSSESDSELATQGCVDLRWSTKSDGWNAHFSRIPYQFHITTYNNDDNNDDNTHG